MFMSLGMHLVGMGDPPTLGVINWEAATAISARQSQIGCAVARLSAGNCSSSSHPAWRRAGRRAAPSALILRPVHGEFIESFLTANDWDFMGSYRSGAPARQRDEAA
jgi:hypothetical protein